MNKEIPNQKIKIQLAEKIKEFPIELIPEKSIYTKTEIRSMYPEGDVFVCDFYVDDIENGEKDAWGFSSDGIINIDHHAPGTVMAKQKSSANLAIEYVGTHGVVQKERPVIINHTDCDSVLSSSIMRGILPPEKQFGDAAIAADHTGVANPIADLLQGTGTKRDITFSLRNLELLLNSQPLEEEAEQLLEKRLNDRIDAQQMVESGAFEKIGDVYYALVKDKIDGGLLPALLPDASVILLASLMKDNPQKWEIKIRLGMHAPDGFMLNSLQLPNFGGRWNAGSTKRSGGTDLTPKSYAELLNQKLNYYSSFKPKLS